MRYWYFAVFSMARAWPAKSWTKIRKISKHHVEFQQYSYRAHYKCATSLPFYVPFYAYSVYCVLLFKQCYLFLDIDNYFCSYYWTHLFVISQVIKLQVLQLVNDGKTIVEGEGQYSVFLILRRSSDGSNLITK